MKENSMRDAIVYVDTSEVRSGKLEELKSAVTKLAAFVEASNPHIMSYRFFLDEDTGRMIVVAVHPNSDALEFHMEIGEAEFRKFADLLDLTSITVYGDVSEAVRKRLERKAQMLGRSGVAIYSSHAGFDR